MTRDLDVFLREHLKPAPLPELPSAFGGQLVAARMEGSSTLGHADYTLISRRGGFYLGRAQWSNQWGQFSGRQLPNDTPLNAQIVAEVHAILRELNKRG